MGGTAGRGKSFRWLPQMRPIFGANYAPKMGLICGDDPDWDRPPDPVARGLFVGAVEVDEVGGGGVVGDGWGGGGFELAEDFGGEDFA